MINTLGTITGNWHRPFAFSSSQDFLPLNVNHLFVVLFLLLTEVYVTANSPLEKTPRLCGAFFVPIESESALLSGVGWDSVFGQGESSGFALVSWSPGPVFGRRVGQLTHRCQTPAGWCRPKG